MTTREDEIHEIAEQFVAESLRLLHENQRLQEALKQIREHERVVNAGSKSWSIANSALQSDEPAIELDPRD